MYVQYANFKGVTEGGVLSPGGWRISRSQGSSRASRFILIANSPIEYVLFSFLQINTTIKLHYPNDLDWPRNEAAADKIRQYRADYNNRPSNAISFMPAIASTSGCLHSEFVRLLF